MKNLLYILFLPFLLAFYSCEQIIDVEVPVHDPVLVLSSFYIAGDMEIEAILTKSAGILTSNDSLNIVEDATINLYEEDVLIYTLNEITVGEYAATLSAPLTIGKEYRMEVIKQGFETVWATQTLPAAVAISDISFEEEGGIDLEGVQKDVIEFKFQDQANEANFYQAIIRHRDRTDTTQNWGQWTWSLDPILEEGWEAPIFSDDILDGENYKLRLLADSRSSGSNSNVVLDFSVITRDKYLLSKSLVAQEIAKDNPFSEPVIVYTNVENGQGVFSMENRSFTIAQ